MICPRCGATVLDSGKFCGDCGSPLPWRCNACGRENPPDKWFCGDCGAAVGANPSAQQAPSASRVLPERRLLTVTFVDLVGSTALGARLDPEELRDVIAAYHGCVTGLVARFEGFVARYMGDGVLAYFGYPQAHEEDAERAVRAGIELIAAVGALQAHALLQTRVGIATGLVVVGDLLIAGEGPERGIIGETPNLAARLQTIAEPNTVLVADSTRRLLGNLFEFEDLGTT